MNAKYCLFLFTYIQDINSELFVKDGLKYSDLDEHLLVHDAAILPYVAAILKKTAYVCTGALINEYWILTAADPIVQIQDPKRLIRVRLGSTNYKKRGELIPIKFYEIHPYYDKKKPIFDLALIRMANKVSFSATINPIPLLKTKKNVAVTHFIVASWDTSLTSSEPHQMPSIESINRRRVLAMTRLHPSEKDECLDELKLIGIKNSDAVVCLDSGINADPCVRDSGGPVVYENTLWGIISSWKPEDCENELAGPSIATLVSTEDVASWIHAVTRGHKWLIKVQ